MVIAVMDSFSRKILALRVVRQEATTKHVVEALEGAVRDAGAPPRHLITDKGTQFFNSRKGKPTAGLQAWLDRHRVKPRFGAVGKKGSIALIERFFRTFKREGMRTMLVPYDIEWMNAELTVFAEWYNTKRPHSALAGATPHEIHSGIAPPRAQPRYEVRAGYPISPEHIQSGKVWRVESVDLDAGCFKRRQHLPDISLRIAA
jgi:putative transposase